MTPDKLPAFVLPSTLLSKLPTFSKLLHIIGRCEQAILRIIKMRLRCFEKYRIIPQIEAVRISLLYCELYNVATRYKHSLLMSGQQVLTTGIRGRKQARSCGNETKKAYKINS